MFGFLSGLVPIALGSTIMSAVVFALMGPAGAVGPAGAEGGYNGGGAESGRS